MQIIEYRITLPLTLEEYQVALLFTINENLETESHEGKIVVLHDEHFDNYPLLGDNKYSSGQFTAKIYQYSSKLPNFLRAVFPQYATEICEEAWDAYPYCRTILTNPIYTKERFYIKIDSLHVANDRGHQNNVHELSDKLLKQRKVVRIDIANDEISPKDYKLSEDPKKFHSIKTGRGPLLGNNWCDNCEPVMTCYKLVTCEFKSFGLQTALESFFQRFEKRIFTNFHRQLFCDIDRWYGLTLADVKRNNNDDRKEDERRVQDKQINLKKTVKTTGSN